MGLQVTILIVYKDLADYYAKKVFWRVVFLILESLGSTELVFILVMALVFFGPRKLPHLSRTLGKNLASFRKASEDFKRTWEREVNLEELNASRLVPDPSLQPAENSILGRGEDSHPVEPLLPTIEPVESDRVVPREPKAGDAVTSPNYSDPSEPVEQLSKRDWL